METKFEEKFGLKIEEMEEILGGVVGYETLQEAGSCVACTSSCMMCTSCVACQSRFADVIPLV